MTLNPEQSVKELDKAVTPFVKKSSEIKISNTKDMEKAAEMLSQVNRYADEIKEKKESITKPINAALKNIRSLFSPVEDKIEVAKSTIREEMSRYQTEKQKIADDEAAKIAARVGEGKGKLKVETAINQIAEINVPEKNIMATTGSVAFRTDKVFNVVDISKLPIEYVVANEVMIRAAMKAGIELPGVEYSTKQVPVNSR